MLQSMKSKKSKWVTLTPRKTSITLNLMSVASTCLSQGSLQLKAGVKLSERNKSAEESVWIFEDFEDNGVQQLTLDKYSNSTVNSNLSKFGAAIDSGSIYSLINTLDPNDFVDDVESAINDYQVDEEINAGYFMAHFEHDNWQLISGLRYEARPT